MDLAMLCVGVAIVWVNGVWLGHVLTKRGYMT